jgi:hypothetical protein
LVWLTPTTSTVSPLSVNSDRAVTQSKVAPPTDQLLSAATMLDRRLETAFVSPGGSSSQLGAIDRVFSDDTLDSIDNPLLKGIPGSL